MFVLSRYLMLLIALGGIVIIYGFVFYQRTDGNYILMLVGGGIVVFAGIASAHARAWESRLGVSRTTSGSHNKRSNPDSLEVRIAAAYERDRETPSVRSFLGFVRESRKFGFPVMCTLHEASTQQQMRWAACLLLQIVDTWPIENVPDDIEFEPGTTLFIDAEYLLMNALGCTQQFVATYFPDNDRPDYDYEQSAQ